MVVCKYYLQGNCTYGARCKFEHPRSNSFINKTLSIDSILILYIEDQQQDYYQQPSSNSNQYSRYRYNGTQYQTSGGDNRFAQVVSKSSNKLDPNAPITSDKEFLYIVFHTHLFFSPKIYRVPFFCK